MEILVKFETLINNRNIHVESKFVPEISQNRSKSFVKDLKFRMFYVQILGPPCFPFRYLHEWENKDKPLEISFHIYSSYFTVRSGCFQKSDY